jgi:hypothetical protein
MINKKYTSNLLTAAFAFFAIVLVSGSFSTANGQTRDPFAKPGWARTKENKPGGPGKVGVGGSAAAIDLGLPSIESRIDYYKKVREAAAAAGQAIPKVTSVLALSEMAVTGIFKTPRGYAAMVEAQPIRLSYTIYPGEKFFDGQLVAVEENRLVFRKVIKMSNGKFTTSVENMALRKYSDREQIQGTAPADATSASKEQPKVPVLGPDGQPVKVQPIVSPLDEMNKQVSKEDPSKSSKPASKPVRVAKKGK